MSADRIAANARKAPLEDIRVHVRIKLALLWTALMFCYVYGDYFALYIPGKLDAMRAGRMGPLGEVTQGVLLGTAIMMAVPGLMAFLSLILPPWLNRVVNAVLGVAYAAIMALAARGSGWQFYWLLGIVEIVLCLTIVWHAWRWPRQVAA
jgi:hypothetical protein